MKRGKFNNWIIKTSHFLDQLRRKDSGSVIDLLTNISIESLLKQVIGPWTSMSYGFQKK